MPTRSRSESKSDGKNVATSDGEDRVNYTGTSNRLRSSSRLASKKVLTDASASLESDSDHQEDESHSNDEESEMEEAENDDYEENDTRKLRRNVRSQVKLSQSKPIDVETRRSARSTKFSSSMAEPSNSIKEFQAPKQNAAGPKSKLVAANKDNDYTDESEESQSEEEIMIRRPQAKSKDGKYKKTATSKTRGKSNTVKKKQILESSDEEEYDDEDEPMKIQKIIASRTETKRKWLEICSKMNTTEILGGSRWHQDSDRANDEAISAETVSRNEIGEGTDMAAEKLDSSKKDIGVINDDDVFEERFLVKWSACSFLHCSWETQDDLVNLIDSGQNHLRTFFRKNVNGLLFTADERCDGDYFDPGFTQIERILEAMPPDHLQPPGNKVRITTTAEDEENFNEASFDMIYDATHPDFEKATGRLLYIKWCNLPYSECTVESERDLILHDIEYKSHLIAFLKRRRKPSRHERTRSAAKGMKEYARLENLFKTGNANEIDAFKKSLQEHVFKNGGQLRDYQAEGVAWMISNFISGRSSILCDEMGLGKTLQTAATCDYIINNLGRPAPILIVAPLSTLAHWYREFNRWTDLNAIVYHGTLDDRRVLREFELVFETDRPKTTLHPNSLYLKKCLNPKASKHELPWMINVVITTPEMLVTPDHNELGAIRWGALVVDEAHRMKNHNSKLGTNLRKDIFQFDHKILLTGTPIQNDVKEFWTILNFIDPNKFSDGNAFMEKYGDMKSKELLDELHDEIRPFILRRLKEDVEKSVPPKEETVIEVELSVAQKQYYRALYEKNLKFLHKNKKKALDGPSLNNLSMQLRKVCNHLFLLNGIEKEFRSQVRRENLSDGDLLTRGSGKLVLLDKLLPRLREEGHRVLLFSQFKIMLDLLEDYFNARSMKFERIDGSITGRRRQQAIDRFQSPDSNSFIMMLTTRAGGVGINLTAADTCIIFDSDWNPQNDLQAQARCHRIGQTKSVKVYRLLSRKSYELQMFQMSSLKMGLEQAVMNGVAGASSNETSLSKEEIEKLLRHGAYDIFNEEKNGSAEAESNDFVQLDIDSILERRSRTVVHDNTGSNSGAAGGTFSKASFKLSRPVGDMNADAEDIDIEDPDFWTKTIGEVADEPTDDPAYNLMLTTRRERKQINSYSERDYQKKLTSMIGDSETDMEDDDESEDEADLGSNQERSKWGGSLSEDWTKEDAENLVKALWTFGYALRPWEEFKSLISKEIKHSITEIKHMSWSIIFAIIKETADDEAETARKRDNSDRARNKLTDDSVLVSTGNIDIKEIKEKAFRSVVRSLSRWFEVALADAVEKAKVSQPRGKDVVSKLKNLNSHDEQKDPSSIFATNVWPSLKSRGWKVTIPTEGNYAGKSIYSFKDKEFSSTDAVLSEVLLIHPELRNAVESILQQTKESRQQTQAAAEKEREQDLSLTVDTISYETLEFFFYRYAPLQIVVDRTKSRRIRLSRKVLASCNMLLNASSLLAKALKEQQVNLKNEKLDVVELLANSLVIDKRWLLPHPSWTVRHDAILIQAVNKHGWVDNDSSFSAIADKSITKWGWPFDAVHVRTTNEESSPLEKGHFRAACDRAAKFLNEEQALISEMRGFNQHLIIRAFGLVKNFHVSNKWFADPDAAPMDNFNDDVTAEMVVNRAQLPSKKDMTKRAKTVLCHAILTFDSRKTVNIESASQFAQVDQSNKCNLLLVELMRALQRENAGSKSSHKVCALASSEAKARLEEMACSLKDKSGVDTKDVSDDTAKKLQQYRTIVENLELVKRNLNKSVRQYKNVLRVMLGEEPQKGKHSDEDLFPNDKPSVPLITSHSKDNDCKWLNTIADITLDKARKRLLTNFATRDGMKNMTSLLHLTEIETFILSALCKLGVPVWSRDWKKSISASTASSFPKDVCSWHYLGYFVMKVANIQFKKASERLEASTNEFKMIQRSEQMTSNDMSNPKAQASSNLRKAQHLFDEKKEVFRQATDYQANSDHLAKKSILLLAKILTETTSVSLVSGLDSKILVWLENEVRRWATSLDLLADNGQPLAFTAIDFLEDLPANERESIKVFSSFDKHACKTVLEQTAMVTRLRSIFGSYAGQGARLREKIIAAIRNVKNSGSPGWEMQPVGWEDYKDVVLLHRVARNGFTDALLTSKDDFGEQGTFADFPYTAGSTFLAFGAIQARATQLVRELNAAEERSQTSRVLEDRLNRNAREPELVIRKATTINLQSESVPDPLRDEFCEHVPNSDSSDLVEVDKKRGSSESGLDLRVVESPEKKNRLI